METWHIYDWQTVEIMLEIQAATFGKAVEQAARQRLGLHLAQLKEADLRRLDLSHALLREAELTRADLRYADLSNPEGLERFLADWERWAADLAESHSAYPMLAFYRSQHHNNSWLASLTLVLDVSTLLLAGAEKVDLLQAAACHAAARRVLIELTGALNVKPVESTARDRILPPDLCRIAAFFQSAGIGWQDGDRSAVIGQLRLKYEAMLEGLSAYLLLPLPQMGNFGLVPGKPTGRTDLIRRLVEPEAQVPIRQSRNRGELYARQDSRKPPHEQSR